MNIKEFLDTDYSRVQGGTNYTICNTYIEIHNNLFIGDDSPNHVIIDEVLDITGGCCLYKANMRNIINVSTSVFINNNNKLLPGSFVGKRIFHNTNQPNKNPKHNKNYVEINGYITQSGIIS